MLFVILAFAISWLGYLPAFAATHGSLLFQNKLWQACLLLTATGPALAAWAATSFEKPSTTVGNRLRSAFFRAVPAIWWLTAAFLPPALLLIANALTRSNSSDHIFVVAPASATLVLLNSIVSVFANPFEEIGWRGFALPCLLIRFPSIVAALLTSVITALWHLPLFLLPQSPMHAYPFWTWTTGAITHSIFLTWLYNVSGGSLAVTSLFHISFNIFGAILGTRAFLILAAVEVVAVFALLLLLGPSLGRAASLPNHAK